MAKCRMFPPGVIASAAKQSSCSSGLPRRYAPRNDRLVSMILEQDPALLLQRDLDRRGEHAEHAGQKHFQVHLGLFHIDRRLDRIAQRLDAEVELIARPSRLYLGAAGNMLFELVDVV